jgi:hypothetical protein
MARGKHAHRKANRDNQALEEELARLTTEVAVAKETLAKAQKAARERAELDEKLKRCLANRDRAVADEHARLAGHVDVLRAVRRDTRDVTKRLGNVWEAYCDAFLNAAGGKSTETVELLATTLMNDSGAGRIYISDTPRGSLSTQAVVRIEQARGERRLGYAEAKGRRFEDATPLAPRALRAELDEWISSNPIHDQNGKASDHIMKLLREWNTATAYTLTPTAALAGHPHPQVDTVVDLEHPVARLLGVDFSGPEMASSRTEPPQLDALLSDRAWHALRDPWQAADRLLPLWRVGRDIVREGGRIITPMHPTPRHPSPADAVALRHWYSLAATGAWARNDPDDAARGYGEAAVGLAVASTYWMPPGQVHGYLDSDPISLEDRDRLRLSYPNVFLALGKPIILDPTDVAAPVSKIDLMEETALGLARRNANVNSPRSWVFDEAVPVNSINLMDLIAARGALIEGLLMVSDYEGIPNGRIAWCVAVPARVGVLGRWVLPAHRDRTFYADEVDALLAVAAWADWHPPADPETKPTVNHRRSAALYYAAARGRVHVLNAARTASASESTTPTGRTVTAHIRRGHWRRQRVGPGRTETRMVRVSAAIVGAGNRPLTTGVYRLPSNPSAGTSTLPTGRA